MIDASRDTDHVRRAVLACHAAVVRSMNARSRRAQLKNAKEALGELNTALEVLPSWFKSPGAALVEKLQGGTVETDRLQLFVAFVGEGHVEFPHTLTELSSAVDLFNAAEEDIGGDQTVWYGPHPCARCGKIIAKAGKEFGGREVNYPDDGPIYPNTSWTPHVCAALVEGREPQ